MVSYIFSLTRVLWPRWKHPYCLYSVYTHPLLKHHTDSFVESLHLAGISVSQLVTKIVLRLLESSKHRTQCAVLCRLVCCIQSQCINWHPMCLLVSFWIWRKYENSHRSWSLWCIFLPQGLCSLYAFKQNFKMKQIYQPNMPTNVKRKLFSPIAFCMLKLQNSIKLEIIKGFSSNLMMSLIQLTLTALWAMKCSE